MPAVVVMIIVTVLIIFFLPDILSAITGLFIGIAVITGLLVALNMILKSSREKYKMQLNNQVVNQPTQDSNTQPVQQTAIPAANSTEGDMNMF